MITSKHFPNGHYDDNGYWQRDKYCFVPCPNCDCGPPVGVYYDARYDKRIKEDQQKIDDDRNQPA